MNRRQALYKARRTLANGGIEDASLEGEILLRHILKLDRSRLFSSLENDLTVSQEKALKHIIWRRVRGEPVAYITGYREFYGLDFQVNQHVLIPRPETELLVEKAIRIARRFRIDSIADVGTGCGAIAVSLSVNLPHVIIYATDVSPAALNTARVNGRRNGVSKRVKFLQGDMLEPLPETVDMIVANLPYVGESELHGNDLLRYEPRLALDGGSEGTDVIRTLCLRADEKLRPGGWLLLEIGLGQAEAVTELIQGTYPTAKIELESDLAGIERVISVRLTQS